MCSFALLYLKNASMFQRSAFFLLMRATSYSLWEQQWWCSISWKKRDKCKCKGESFDFCSGDRWIRTRKNKGRGEWQSLKWRQRDLNIDEEPLTRWKISLYRALTLLFPVCKICPVDTLLRSFYIAELEQTGFTISAGGGAGPVADTC